MSTSELLAVIESNDGLFCIAIAQDQPEHSQEFVSHLQTYPWNVILVSC